MKSVLITGASTGIGRACAVRLAKAGWRVFGSVRKPADAASLEADLGPHGRAVLFDVSDGAALQAAAAQVGEALQGGVLHGLVNNAGIALPGPLLEQPLDEVQRVLDVNFTGAVRAIQAFAPLMGPLRARGSGNSNARGRIVNITSVSGEFGYPFTAAYVASKHAVEGLSKSLRRELLGEGIDVIVVGPGAVRTPIWDKGAGNGLDRYAGSRWEVPLRLLTQSLEAMDREGLEPDVVAATVETALSARKPKPRYAPVRDPLMNWWLPRLMPTRMVDRVVGERLGLIGKS
jgi:NAD(P)-dependent dehydrogenase (short-subunit alcohol dehydrogenase family)